MSGVMAHSCPRCGANAGTRCKTLTTGRTTDTHDARRLAYWRAFNVEFAAVYGTPAQPTAPTEGTTERDAT